MASTVWRGFLTFGLISVPVRLFRAARAERVQFKRLVRQEPEPAAPVISAAAPALKTGSQLTLVPRKTVAEPSPAPEPVLRKATQASVVEGSDQIVPAQSIVKGYEYEKNRYVEIDAEQLKSAAAETSREMQIQEFVPLAEIDPVYFETSYYLSPEEAGEKAYALLFQSMTASGLVAVAQLAMHNREHAVVVRPGKTGLLVHTLFFASEVRSDEEYQADLALTNEKELALAKTLIHSLAAAFDLSQYRDTYREKVEALIAAKLEGRPAAPVERPLSLPRVDDLTDALHKSLARLKKPAATADQPRQEAETLPGKAKRRTRSQARS